LKGEPGEAKDLSEGSIYFLVFGQAWQILPDGRFIVEVCRPLKGAGPWLFDSARLPWAICDNTDNPG
jgi:hypothetical protein